jgi:CYTH domain-containing protein
LTEKRSLGGITRREIERDLDAATFALLATEADPTRRPVRKTRWTWAEAGQTWELDVFHDPGDLVLLEVELSDANTVVTPPAWLDVVRDVSTDKAYFNWSLASIEASDEEPR